MCLWCGTLGLDPFLPFLCYQYLLTYQNNNIIIHSYTFSSREKYLSTCYITIYYTIVYHRYATIKILRQLSRKNNIFCYQYNNTFCYYSNIDSIKYYVNISKCQPIRMHCMIQYYLLVRLVFFILSFLFDLIFFFLYFVYFISFVCR